MMGTMSNALLSFISEAMILSSTELILFGIAVLGYILMHSFSLRSADDKSAKVCESVVVNESQCTSQEILRRFKGGDYQGVVSLWPAIVCSDCVPGGPALSQIVESMQQVGIQVQTIASDIRRALKQNAGLAADIDGLCDLVENLRLKGHACLLEALLCVFEELESDLGRKVIDTTASALKSLMPPVAGCVLQELQSSTGQRGHEEESMEDEDPVTEEALALSSAQDPNLVAAQLLGGLTVDLAAEIFSFTELSDVRNCAGLACRGLHNVIWRQPDFWVGLGGPVFVDSLCLSKRPSSVVPMIRCFRRWVFGLDGDWSLQLEQMGSASHPSDALRAVLNYVQVLQVGDADLSEIWRLVRAGENAMQRADAQDDALVEVASELVATCQKRQDIFGTIDSKDLNAALVAMEKRATQEKLADERNHWFFSDEAVSNEQGASNTADADLSLLSLDFLAVMDQWEQRTC